MADFPSFDLFSEIDDLNRFVSGKNNGNLFEFISLDEDVDMMMSGEGLASHNEGILQDDNNDDVLYGGILQDNDVLADVSSNALLLGDPLLSFPDLNELLELQPASPSQNPETFMPVSLPADSPPSSPPLTTPPPASADQTTSSTSTTTSTPPIRLLSSATPPVLVSKCAGVGRQPHSSVKAAKINTVATQSANVPVRIIVKTQKSSTPSSNMVAPITIQKPTQSLVKIPRAIATIGRSRLQALRSGGKLGPIHVSKTRPASTSTPAVNHPQVSPASPRVQQQQTVPEIAVPVSSEVEETRTSVPFRSLRTRESSEAESSDSTDLQTVRGHNAKRKAYELGPQNDPQMERCRQNAINARRNREEKKAHMMELERKVESISQERDELAGENESLREAKEKLEQQVKHLNNVLRNQSKLSSLLEKLGPASVMVDVTASACGEEIVSSGMCLHVDGDEATIEYCSLCAKKAGARPYHTVLALPPVPPSCYCLR
ncbi:hypothetical protein Pcinc_011759 [Petrolisthes cinctipes]|uniref:BZIP domain-containing protein n=1 Tax=Petrolisthes cinctipes TaxID=88211 RepID=A0AAE1G316_PETCI|nr:hypothetical protein Pcinc_011759 [Petrolisthes cinctipes]